MGSESGHSLVPEVLALATRQHGVVSRRQLLELGWSGKAVRHRIEKGFLHRVCHCVYAVGRPGVGVYGQALAAVLACGVGAALSHESATALWQIRPKWQRAMEVSVPAASRARPRGVIVHRRKQLAAADVTRRHGIPVTSPVQTLVDIAVRLPRTELEAAVNDADRLDLVDPETLRRALDGRAGQPGVAPLRKVLDRRTFVLTDSELERRFLPLVRAAGLPTPETGRYVGGFKVDFFWPELGLVVETDGLRYHRTPAEQARDRLRDQAHVAAGLTALRFTHAQVAFERRHVRRTLQAVARRLKG